MGNGPNGGKLQISTTTSYPRLKGLRCWINGYMYIPYGPSPALSCAASDQATVSLHAMNDACMRRVVCPHQDACR